MDKLTIEELPASSRRYPFVGFTPEREVGKDILFVRDVSKTVDGVKLLDHVSFTVGKNDKIAFVGENELAQTTLFKILMGELEPDSGSIKWGVSTSQSYLPKDNSPYFLDSSDSLIDWIRQYLPSKRTMSISVAFWAGCCFPEKMYLSRSGYCPEGKRSAACSQR